LLPLEMGFPRATSRSLSRAALMAAVADAVRRGAQRAAKFFFSRKCVRSV
jgi:hypothetical protein